MTVLPKGKIHVNNASFLKSDTDNHGIFQDKHILNPEKHYTENSPTFLFVLYI